MESERQHVLRRAGSVVFATAHELLGTGLRTAGPSEAMGLRKGFTVGCDSECEGATTRLLLPFSFWRDEDKVPPNAVAEELLRRTLRFDEEAVDVAMWEKASLPHQVEEFSIHFRALLGYETRLASSTVRLRLTKAARSFLFGGARLWADRPQNERREREQEQEQDKDKDEQGKQEEEDKQQQRSSDFVGKQCEWSDVQLVIFPLGAVLSIEVNWMPPNADSTPFTLADLRSWLYIARMRCVKDGVLRGWSFDTHRKLGSEDAIAQATNALGLKMFASLYGGACVSLASLCNWLISLPSDDANRLPRRIPRYDQCLHHTTVRLRQRMKKDVLDEFLYHLRKGYGSSVLRPVPDADYLTKFTTDYTLKLRDCWFSFSREGIVGLEYMKKDETSTGPSFMQSFAPLSFVLTVHCLSERLTLEKLSYLTALRSQSLDIVLEGMDRQLIQRRLQAVNSMLVRYRASMSTDDCGGPIEARKYFRVMRFSQSIIKVKATLQQQLMDADFVLRSEANEERQKDLESEQRWTSMKNEFAERERDAKEEPKVRHDNSSKDTFFL